MVHLKTPEEISIMREGGKRLSEILRLLVSLVGPGATTDELDREAESRIRSVGGEPAFKGYRAFGIKTPFPGSICISINDEIVHGLPYPKREIREGDVVSIDIGMKYKGFYTDTAYTVGAGPITSENSKLIETARESLDEALAALKSKFEGGHSTIAVVGDVVEDYVESRGFNVVRELVGHGVGKNLHEDPSVPNYRTSGKSQVLQPGLVIAIEPMIYQGKYGVTFSEDDWPVITTHGGSAAHFEHTVAITDKGIEVLT